MSEFKYACPVCGQHIKCDSEQSGTTMECPTCFQKITAPQAPESDESKFILHGTKVGERPVPSVVINAGFLPVPEKKLSTPVLVFAVLLCAGAVALFVFQAKNFMSVPATTAPVPTTTVAATESPSFPATNRSAADVTAGGNRNNLAWSKAVSASSQEAGNPVQNGNDGNIGTRWCAANGDVPQWWQVDLGGTVTITNTRVIWEKNTPYQYSIKVSPDQTNWTVAVDKNGNTTAAQTNSDNFSATGRYVRIVVTGLQPHAWASFFEFQVFGSTNGGSGNSTR